MIGRENVVVLTGVLLAFPVAYAVDEFTAAPTAVWMGAFLFVGVVAPQLVNATLDRRAD